MSMPPWGDSVVFETAAGNHDESQGITVSLQPVLTNPLNVDGRKPLPYPPDDLRCVLLQASGSHNKPFDSANAGTGSQYAVVFVGLHNDLYNGAWVVHESAYHFPSPELNATLEEVGCMLELAEVKE